MQIHHMHKIIITKISWSLWMVGGLWKFHDSNVVVIQYLSVERKAAKHRLRQICEVEGILLLLTSATWCWYLLLMQSNSFKSINEDLQSRTHLKYKTRHVWYVLRVVKEPLQEKKCTEGINFDDATKQFPGCLNVLECTNTIQSLKRLHLHWFQGWFFFCLVKADYNFR